MPRIFSPSIPSSASSMLSRSSQAPCTPRSLAQTVPHSALLSSLVPVSALSRRCQQHPSTSSMDGGLHNARLTVMVQASMQPAPIRQTAAAAAAASATLPTASSAPQEPTYIVTSVTASTVAGFLLEIFEAAASGVDIIELRLDFLTDFDPERDLDTILSASPLPFIVTYRPTWEG